MYLKEKEIKVININKNDTIKKLEELGCKYIEKNLQQYYVYNFHPFFSEIIRLISIINDPFVQAKYKHDYKINLINVLLELFPLLGVTERKMILKNFKCSLIDELSSKILNCNKIIIENETEFYNIINKYTFNSNKWIRLRKTGDKATLAIKKIKREKSEYNIDSVDELEFEISDFEKCNYFLKELGYNFKAYQEKERISYSFKNKIFFEIDTWPMIPTYLEMESADVDLINEWIVKLGIDKNNVKIMNTDGVYSLYGINIYDYKKLSFDNPIKF